LCQGSAIPDRNCNSTQSGGCDQQQAGAPKTGLGVGVFGSGTGSWRSEFSEWHAVTWQKISRKIRDTETYLPGSRLRERRVLKPEKIQESGFSKP
jgi:hypothetical protein